VPIYFQWQAIMREPHAPKFCHTCQT